MASWERPPSAWEGLLAEPTVLLPYLVNSTLEDLISYLDDARVGPGSVIAIDYLNLVSGDPQENLNTVRSLASVRSWRVFVGKMTRRPAAR